MDINKAVQFVDGFTLLRLPLHSIRTCGVRKRTKAIALTETTNDFMPPTAFAFDKRIKSRFSVNDATLARPKINLALRLCAEKVHPTATGEQGKRRTNSVR